MIALPADDGQHDALSSSRPPAQESPLERQPPIQKSPLDGAVSRSNDAAYTYLLRALVSDPVTPSPPTPLDPERAAPTKIAAELQDLCRSVLAAAVLRGSGGSRYRPDPAVLRPLLCPTTGRRSSCGETRCLRCGTLRWIARADYLATLIAEAGQGFAFRFSLPGVPPLAAPARVLRWHSHLGPAAPRFPWLYGVAVLEYPGPGGTLHAHACGHARTRITDPTPRLSEWSARGADADPARFTPQDLAGAFWGSTLPDADHADQTLYAAAFGHLHYALKNFYDPDTREQHLNLNGSQPLLWLDRLRALRGIPVSDIDRYRAPGQTPPPPLPRTRRPPIASGKIPNPSPDFRDASSTDDPPPAPAPSPVTETSIPPTPPTPVRALYGHRVAWAEVTLPDDTPPPAPVVANASRRRPWHEINVPDDPDTDDPDDGPGIAWILGLAS